MFSAGSFYRLHSFNRISIRKQGRSPFGIFNKLRKCISNHGRYVHIKHNISVRLNHTLIIHLKKISLHNRNMFAVWMKPSAYPHENDQEEIDINCYKFSVEPLFMCLRCSGKDHRTGSCAKINDHLFLLEIELFYDR